MISLRGLILIYRRVSPFHPGVNPHLFLFEKSRGEKSQPRWKESYRSKASVLLYVYELHIPFLLLNWVYADMAIEHGRSDLRTELPANTWEYSRLQSSTHTSELQATLLTYILKDLSSSTKISSTSGIHYLQVTSWMIEIGLDKTNLFYATSSNN